MMKRVLFASSRIGLSYAKSRKSSYISKPAQINRLLQSYIRVGFSTAVCDDVNVNLDELILEPVGIPGQESIKNFNLSEKTLKNLERIGITHLFPVQSQSFNVMMSGSDIVGRSRTGSGKTLAFALPIIEMLRISSSRSRFPKAIVLLPTRELSLQVQDEFKRIAPHIHTVNIVGGVSYSLQEAQLRKGVDVLVGTPGRIIDLVEKGSLSLSEIEISVLDEADMMMKFGFQEAVESIMSFMPNTRQCVMWSATFPKWVKTLSKKYMKDPVSIDLVGHDETHVPTTVTHKAIHAPSHSRMNVLENILQHTSDEGQIIVFTETKQEADEIATTMNVYGVRALHGDLSQGMRTSTIKGFRNGSVKILACTDIAARGLDISNVEYVIQYRLSRDKESFVHRAGRTGRAGRSGTNIVLFDRRDVDIVASLEKLYKFNFLHASPPDTSAMVQSTVDRMRKRLDSISPNTVRLFESAALNLFNDKGIDALSAALAVASGLDSKDLSSFSMISGKAQERTIEIAGLSSAREVQTLLFKTLGVSYQGVIHTLDDKFVLDFPEFKISSLVDLAERMGASVVPVSELPRLLVESTRGGFGRRRDAINVRDRRDGRGRSRTGFHGNGQNSRGRERLRTFNSFDDSFSNGRRQKNKLSHFSSANSYR
jgi:ATP-dependent RNA helicase DDX21